ncbi:trichohyalin-like isoform X2 [Solea solea]|uniref:trichohyalin-like isoform X2 n=1 Tax=Solea solea TaxID=90069 RepID=UPI002729C9DD|nr:trichohyalin-like isoform X2 [Solea solea]
MDKSRDHVEAFPQEIRQQQVTAGPSSPGDAAEACISQQPTPVPEAGTRQEQRGALFHMQEGETSQSRGVNIYQHLPSVEEHEPGAGSDEKQQHSIDVKQLEDKETQVDMKTNREAVKRQRQLTRQMMEAVEQQWDESQTQRNEIAFLRTKTEQQHRDINRLTAENHEQFTATKALTLKMEKVIEKLKENKSEAAQEKMQLLKIRAEIDQERKTLDRQRNEIVTERCKLEMIKYGESKEESKTHKVLTIKPNQEMTERLRADRLLRAIHDAKLAKEQLERSIKDINQELQISKNYISEHKSHIEDVKRNFNVYINKMKQKWTRNPSDSEMQRVPEVEQRVGHQERQDTSDSVRVKLGKIWEEMEKGWDVLGDNERRLEMTVTEKLELKPDLEESTRQEMKANIEQDRKTLDRDRQLAKAEMDELKSMRESNERLKQELEERFQKTRREIRELEVLNNEIEMKKKELAKMIRLSKKNKETKKETEHATRDLKDRQDTMAEQVETPEVNPAVMQKVIFDVQETRKLLHMIREDAQHGKRVLAEEVKWENFQQKKKKRKLEQWMEKTTKERDELEIMKIQMQRRREEDEQKLKDTITTLGMMGDVKDNMEKAVTEISNTREEMLKAQRQMEKNKEDVRTFMDKLSSLRAWASRWISTESAIRNSLSENKSQLQTPQRATHRESHMEQTQEVPAEEEDRVEGPGPVPGAGARNRTRRRTRSSRDRTRTRSRSQEQDQDQEEDEEQRGQVW